LRTESQDNISIIASGCLVEGTGVLKLREITKRRMRSVIDLTSDRNYQNKKENLELLKFRSAGEYNICSNGDLDQ
jgi:hypothetical protein